MATIVMLALSVASLFAVPVTHRYQGEPLSLMCVGVLAVGALRRRTQNSNDNDDAA